MGRGTSKVSGGGMTSVTSVTTQSGDVVDLSSMPLMYGGHDAALDGKSRQVVEAFEQKRLKYKTEAAILVDADGNQLGNEFKGNRDGVKVPFGLFTSATVMTHNHPRGKGEEGVIGGTFSDADLFTFSETTHLKTMRASATEGAYSISKSKNFDSKGFNDFVRKTNDTRYNEYRSYAKGLGSDYRKGKIDYETYRKQNNQAFNKMLVDTHNDLIDGQKKYGYTYTLEKR